MLLLLPRLLSCISICLPTASYNKISAPIKTESSELFALHWIYTRGCRIIAGENSLTLLTLEYDTK